LYLAGHGTQDMHYFVWKIKSNTIAYMNGANVKSFHSEISQSSVNRLDRGSMWVAPKSLEEYALAYEEKDLDWSKQDEHLDLQISDSLEDELENEKDEEDDDEVTVQEVKNSTKKTVAKRLYEDDELDLTQRDIAERLDISQASVSNAVS
jgi:transcriptional regulator with XRE-family HTH domain